MNKQSKVTQTRMHEINIRDSITDKRFGDWDEVPVAEGKLVLLNGGRIFGASDFEEMRKAIKPIIISETEKIEVGDWVVNHIAPFHNPYQVKDENQLALINKANKMSTDESKPRGIDKVLALPENFSPKHLQAIVDGKMKDGDKVLVECDILESLPPQYQISLNSGQHITLYKVEVKMYTREEVISIMEGYAYHSERNGFMCLAARDWLNTKNV